MRNGFNPRARAGRDLNINHGGNRETVSIHAPARGATFSPLRYRNNIASFNPRARAGRDLQHVNI